MDGTIKIKPEPLEAGAECLIEGANSFNKVDIVESAASAAHTKDSAPEQHTGATSFNVEDARRIRIKDEQDLAKTPEREINVKPASLDATQSQSAGTSFVESTPPHWQTDNRNELSVDVEPVVKVKQERDLTKTPEYESATNVGNSAATSLPASTMPIVDKITPHWQIDNTNQILVDTEPVIKIKKERDLETAPDHETSKKVSTNDSTRELQRASTSLAASTTPIVDGTTIERPSNKTLIEADLVTQIKRERDLAVTPEREFPKENVIGATPPISEEVQPQLRIVNSIQQSVDKEPVVKIKIERDLETTDKHKNVPTETLKAHFQTSKDSDLAKEMLSKENEQTSVHRLIKTEKEATTTAAINNELGIPHASALPIPTTSTPNYLIQTDPHSNNRDGSPNSRTKRARNSIEDVATEQPELKKGRLAIEKQQDIDVVDIDDISLDDNFLDDIAEVLTKQSQAAPASAINNQAPQDKTVPTTSETTVPAINESTVPTNNEEPQKKVPNINDDNFFDDLIDPDELARIDAKVDDKLKLAVYLKKLREQDEAKKKKVNEQIDKETDQIDKESFDIEKPRKTKTHKKKSKKSRKRSHSDEHKKDKRVRSTRSHSRSRSRSPSCSKSRTETMAYTPENQQHHVEPLRFISVKQEFLKSPPRSIFAQNMDAYPTYNEDSTMSANNNEASGWKPIKLEKLHDPIKSEDQVPESKREKAIRNIKCVQRKYAELQNSMKLAKFTFDYTPTICKLPHSTNHVFQQIYEHRSPLHNVNNVTYKFNSHTKHINLHGCGLEQLSPVTTKIAKIVGLDIATLKAAVNDDFKLPIKLQNIKEESKQCIEESIEDSHSLLYTHAMTQTDVVTVIAGRPKPGLSKGVQAVPYACAIGAQTDAELNTLPSTLSSGVNKFNNDWPLMQMMNTFNQNQLLALNDFAELLCEPMIEDLFRLRQRMVDIYQSAQKSVIGKVAAVSMVTPTQIIATHPHDPRQQRLNFVTPQSTAATMNYGQHHTQQHIVHPNLQQHSPQVIVQHQPTYVAVQPMEQLSLPQPHTQPVFNHGYAMQQPQSHPQLLQNYQVPLMQQMPTINTQYSAPSSNVKHYGRGAHRR